MPSWNRKTLSGLEPKGRMCPPALGCLKVGARAMVCVQNPPTQISRPEPSGIVLGVVEEASPWIGFKGCCGEESSSRKNDVPAASQGSHQITEVTGSGGGVREEVGQDMPAGV